MFEKRPTFFGLKIRKLFSSNNLKVKTLLKKTFQQKEKKMGKPQRRRKSGQTKNKFFSRNNKQKNVGGFEDLIYENLNEPSKIEAIKNRDADINLPGLGQFYCVHCDKYCVDKSALIAHMKTKEHKRRVKTMKVKPYDHKEAEILNI